MEGLGSAAWAEQGKGGYDRYSSQGTYGRKGEGSDQTCRAVVWLAGAVGVPEWSGEGRPRVLAAWLRSLSSECGGAKGGKCEQNAVGLITLLVPKDLGPDAGVLMIFQGTNCV